MLQLYVINSEFTDLNVFFQGNTIVRHAVAFIHVNS